MVYLHWWIQRMWQMGRKKAFKIKTPPHQAWIFSTLCMGKGTTKINRRKTSRTVKEMYIQVTKKWLKILDAVRTYMPRTEYIDVWGILTGLEWAETVLAADGDRETTGLMSWGKVPLATTSWTLSFAFCRMLIACWCVIVWSRACPLIARIWSASFSFPSLSRMCKQGRGRQNKQTR